MTSKNTSLTVVPVRSNLGETVAERVKRLQAEAKSLAKEHVRDLMASVATTQRLAAEVAEGGDAYPAGVRDVARRMVEEADARIQTLAAINAKAG